MTRRTGFVAGGLGVAGLLVAGGVALLSPSSSDSGSSSTAGAPASTTTTAPLTPLSVAGVSPAPSTGLSPGGTLTVSFDEPLAPGAQDPTLSPAVAGSWSQSGDALTFTPAGGWTPSTTEHVTVPAGVAGQERGQAVTLAASRSFSIPVGHGSELRLQELLAELGYLPLSFTPAAGAGSGTLATEATTADAVRTTAIPGSFSWRYPNVPSSLAAGWSQGASNVVTRGAVMAFESAAGLTVDGDAGPEVWSALRQAVAARRTHSGPYNYLMVNETGTEELRVWSDGSVVDTILANTGVPGATTAPGTYPVYLRYSHQIMRGTDTDGTKYAVPVSWIAYFNGSDAVHGYPRASYGFPQSNGCVELPVAEAGSLWNSSQGYDAYGTLVHVSAGPVGT